MVIRKVKGELLVECTECGAEQYGGVSEWTEFIEFIKDKGWKTTKDKAKEEWIHLCPDCANV